MSEVHYSRLSQRNKPTNTYATRRNLQLVGAMNGAPKEKLLAKGGFVPDGLPDDYWWAMKPPLHPEVAEVVLEASHAEREPPVIRNSGYVVRTIEAALWAFGRSSGFEEGCLLVANLGDDSDTVAAIYGQVR